jgi:trehalose synthase
MAWDDPEGWKMYHDIRNEARGDSGIHIFTNLTGVGNIEVNAFQRLSEVVIQKSIREGFGLVVSESTWKGTPVVAGRAGGIPLQLQDGAGGFLVDSIQQCAEQTLWLLRNPEEGKVLAAKGRELVRQRFLLPRLIADELRLCSDLLGIAPAAAESAAKVGLSGEYRDPVCGMRVDPRTPFTAAYGGRTYHFCSESCRQQFEDEPERQKLTGTVPTSCESSPSHARAHR